MNRKTVDLRRIVGDIESGLGDVPIMEKYHLSPADLMAILEKLGETQTLEPNTILNRIQGLRNTSDYAEMRVLPRNYVVFSIPISDANDSSITGSINDITENGLQIEGIGTSAGEVRSFIIRSDVIPLESPIEFDAQCRWVGTEDTNGQHVAGFEINMISEGSLGRLRRLIKQLTIGEPG